jgi:hypothetical protein
MMVTLIWLMMASLKRANSTSAKFVAYLSVVRCYQKIYGFVGFHILAVFGFKQFSDIAFNLCLITDISGIIFTLAYII